MEDVLDVYQRPDDPKYPQVCLDEISKTLHATPRGAFPLQPGKPRREDYEYERHGQCALFLPMEPLRGFRRVWVSPRRTKLDFAQVLKELIEDVYPDAEKVVLVIDNLNIHHAACLYERFPAAEARHIAARIEWHYTPEHASWLNIAECELPVLRRQCLKSRIAAIETVITQVDAWQDQRNQKQIGIYWPFTTEDAHIKLKRLYPIVKVQDLN
jgi:hypothetical protein